MNNLVVQYHADLMLSHHIQEKSFCIVLKTMKDSQPPKDVIVHQANSNGQSKQKIKQHTFYFQGHGFQVSLMIYQGLHLPGAFETRAVVPTLRAELIPLFRELDGAFEDVEELAEEGLFPSTESSSSKFLSAKEKATR